jgi:hypothetical protein
MTSKNKFFISDEKAQKIINKCMKTNILLWVKTGAWGNRKAISKTMLTEKFQNNAKAVSAAQKLIDHEAIKEVTAPITNAFTYIRANCFPWLTEGVYFVSEDKIEGIEKKLKETKELVEGLKEEFKNRYPLLKAEAKKNYPELYKEEYYPSANAVTSKFKFIWGWQKISLPFADNSVSLVSNDVMELENKKFKEMIKGVAEETIQMLRESFYELIIKLGETLKTPDKKFKDATVKNPIAFLEKLKEVNIYNDKPFMELSEQLLGKLKGIQIDDLRDDKKYRRQIGKEVEKMVSAVNELPTVKYKRALEF